MVMNGFDTNFDADNEVYAVNTVAHHFMHEPDARRRSARWSASTSSTSPSSICSTAFTCTACSSTCIAPAPRSARAERTDTVMLCQGERAILETRFRYPGQFMFHAHQSEFAELGWMGLFEAVGGAS